MMVYKPQTALGRAIARGAEYPGANDDAVQAADEVVLAAEKVIYLHANSWHTGPLMDPAVAALHDALTKSRKA